MPSLQKGADQSPAIALQNVGSDFHRKFWRCFFAEAALVLVPLASFFGLVGVLALLHTAEDLQAIIIIGTAAFLVILYLPVALWLFFYFPKKILYFRPFPDAATRSTQAMIDSLSTMFEVAEKDGKNIFDVHVDGNRVRITWSAAVYANQLLSVSGQTIKHLFILTFREPSKTMKLVQRDVRINWGLTGLSVFAGLQFSQGVFMEYEREFVPSLIFSADGAVRFDVQRIRYNSNEIVKTVLYVAAKNGWAVQFAMV